MIELPLRHDDMPRLGAGIEWPVRPAVPDRSVVTALDEVRRAPTILAALRVIPAACRATEDAVAEGASAGSLLAPIQEAIDDEADTVTALAAVHALARVPGPRADIELRALIHEAPPGFESHAIWALAERPATPELFIPLARAVAAGGLTGMHAQRVLAGWAEPGDTRALTALVAVLREVAPPHARRYLVETVGLISTAAAGLILERVALDGSEPLEVRLAAVSAFAGRTADRVPAAVAGLARRDDGVGMAVRTMQAQRRLSQRGPRRDARRDRGLRVAQIHLAAPLDPAGLRSGAADAGGVATLLSHLGVALADRARIAEVVSIGRTAPGERLPSTLRTPGQRHERVPLAVGEGATFLGDWPSVVAAARGIRAALLAGATPDVIHLRMADPGSLAGAQVAQELGIPLVFTLAPDPHAPIDAAERAGSLDRRTFAAEDGRGALWYRALLVQRLARMADQLVLFPRSDLAERIADLTGIELHAGPPRHTVVAEGIDLGRSDRAAAVLDQPRSMPAVISDLQRAITALPRARHGLPLVVSVGRLQQAKGMARLVEAFALDEGLAARANLIIVGGDLSEPSADEAAELARIKQLLDEHPGLAERVVLLGRRSNDDTRLVLAAAGAGWGGLIGPDGAYACASPKEEFGLAILEALAAGLPVVAPREGGPRTYLENGRTGYLADTTDARALAAAAVKALDLAQDPGTTTRTRSVVAERYTLERMARMLTAVYRLAAGATTLASSVDAQERRAA